MGSVVQASGLQRELTPSWTEQNHPLKQEEPTSELPLASLGGKKNTNRKISELLLPVKKSQRPVFTDDMWNTSGLKSLGRLRKTFYLGQETDIPVHGQRPTGWRRAAVDSGAAR